jgi:Sigma-70, region 4
MSPLQDLAPDQRAILELLLRQRRSYAELAEMLDLPETGVRGRAHAALAALAPDRPAPAGEGGAVADWILGQQDDDEAGRTRESIARMPAWRAWAAAVTDRLADVEGAEPPAVPGVPAAEDGAATGAEPVHGGRAAKPASRLGGALLIGALALMVAAGLFLILSGGDEPERTAAGAGATATPGATPQVVNQIALRGDGTAARGLMRVFRRPADGRLVFALAAERMPANQEREVYAVWFTKPGAAPRNLGFAQTQVGEEGVFTTGGPQQGQEAQFATWLVDYHEVVVARAGAQSASETRPGAVVLRGTLPGGRP